MTIGESEEYPAGNIEKEILPDASPETGKGPLAEYEAIAEEDHAFAIEIEETLLQAEKMVHGSELQDETKYKEAHAKIMKELEAFRDAVVIVQNETQQKVAAGLGDEIDTLRSEMATVKIDNLAPVPKSLKERIGETTADGKEIVWDIEDADTPKEIRRSTTVKGLDLMKTLLNNGSDYVVFASTALYLHGKESGIAELDVPPGDFDAAVASIEDLKDLRTAIGNVPGSHFENNGDWKRFSDGAIALQGHITMEVPTSEGMVKADYPFEIFYNSFIISDRIMEQSQRVDGLNALSLEGLQMQYFENLKLESKVGASVRETAKFLLNPKVEKMMKQSETHPTAKKLAKRLQLSTKDINEFYEARDSITGERALTEDEMGELQGEMARTLSGLKTKLEKRKRDLDRLRKLRKLKVGSKKAA